VGQVIQIAIADDHGVVRHGLRLLIEAQSDMQVAVELNDGARVCSELAKTPCDVLLLDLSMPTGGLDVLNGMRNAGMETRVLVLTMHERPVYARRALDAGAAGYLLKHRAGDELLAAVRAIARGETYVDAAVADDVASTDEQVLEPRVPLSPRELEVLRFIAEGHTNQETADALGLSVKTVEGYRARVAQKLSARSRADLVRYALHIGLL
jgi:two-component system response regulator NreC